jgi:hypothetical protein
LTIPRQRSGGSIGPPQSICRPPAHWSGVTLLAFAYLLGAAFNAGQHSMLEIIILAA